MTATGQGDEPKSPIEDKVRLLFRQGKYAETVPLIKDHLATDENDTPAYELLADALRYSGDKGGAAAALATASELYSAAGLTLQQIACQKKLDKLGVPPDFSSIRRQAAEAPSAAAADRVRTPLFDELGDDEFQEIAEGLQSHAYEPGETVIAEGAEGDSMYVVTKGTLEVFTRSGASDVKLADLGAGDFFGESALLSGKARTATVKAKSSCECLILSKDSYEEAIARYPRILAVMEDFNRRRAANAIDVLVKKHRGH